jgi:hypothetical protein
MIAALLLALAPLARWIATPAEARIGQPVEWQLEIRVEPGSVVLLPDKDPPLAPAWLLLEPRRVERAEEGGQLLTRVTWKLLALEPGAAPPFAFEVPVEARGGRVSLQPEPAQLTVRGELAQGEDAPRPQRGFLPPPPEERERGWLLWPALALLLACAAAVAWLLRRRRRPTPGAVPGPLEHLARLEREFAGDPALAREVVFALTRLVRERTDEQLASPRAALPDEEWVRLVAGDARLSEPVRAAARRLLERAEAVKYAQASPSRFLVEELCAEARVALAAEERAA